MGTSGYCISLENNLPRKGDWLAGSVMGACLGMSLYVFSQSWDGAETYAKFYWFTLSWNRKRFVFNITMLINPLSSLMLVVVTLISFLVHLYSIEYMFDKKIIPVIFLTWVVYFFYDRNRAVR